MLTIFTHTDHIAQIQAVINSEDRLNELVAVRDFFAEKPEASAFSLIVRKLDHIAHTIDWYNVLPPFLMPEEIPYSPANLLGLVFGKLGNFEKAYAYLQDNQVLANDLDIINCLQNGIPLNPSRLSSDFSPFENYRLLHNSAILHHYAATEQSYDADKTCYFYEEALQNAPNGEYFAFTARHFASFLTDNGEMDIAERVLQDALNSAVSEEAIPELKATLCAAWLKKLVIPYDQTLLDKLKTTLWEVLQYYKETGRSLEEGLLLVDAAQVANYCDSFSEALGYINRATTIFNKAEQPELYAQAHYRRGILLYTWAKNGNPQFFKGALDSFREAVSIFTREDSPEVFADIQQYLGVIYSELPDEVLKRSLWAAVSSSAFQEALAFYNKKQYPYEYAMVCNNYGNALTKYPAAVHTDNIEKALFYYNEALEIRSAEAWPLERAVTLLNYIEACWALNLSGKSNNDEIYQDMLQKAREAQALARDPQLIEEAAVQLSKLEALAAVLAAEQS